MPKACDFFSAIAAETGMNKKDVKKVLDAIVATVAREVKKSGAFKIPKLAAIKMIKKRAREAGTRKMFGKDVQVLAKPATTAVKAYPSKQICDAIR